MIWRRRKPAPPQPAPRHAAPPQPSEETRRARAAARDAAIQLDQVRAQRDTAEQSQRELDDLNAHNGFYMLIRNAWGA